MITSTLGLFYNQKFIEDEVNSGMAFYFQNSIEYLSGVLDLYDVRSLGFRSINIQLNCCETSIYGDTKKSVLASFPLDPGKVGEDEYFSFKLEYTSFVDITMNPLFQIEMSFMDEYGHVIDFCPLDPSELLFTLCLEFKWKSVLY